MAQIRGILCVLTRLSHGRRPLDLVPLSVAIMLVLVGACTGGTGRQSIAGAPAPAPIKVAASSENQPLEPIVKEFAAKNNLKIDVEYQESIDLMRRLESGKPDFDAVWPASSIWVALGDRQRLVSSQLSIYRSPVIFGVKRSVADRLGWVGATVGMGDILREAEAGRIRFVMASASQSDSGASAYVGMLYAFAGSPDILTAEHLQDPAVRDKVRRLLGAINRSAGSTAALKTLMVEKYADFDAIFADEAAIIEMNLELVRSGKEPLQAIYPYDGTTIADYPLGYVDRGDKGKEETFRRLQSHLLSEPVQTRILELGRRAGLIGIDPASTGNAPRSFNPEWGIDVSRNLTPIRFPKPDVIFDALSLYQTGLRKGSLTVYALDFSGSMAGDGEKQLKDAMRSLLDQEQARRALLQASPDDITIVLTFSGAILTEWKVKGNDPSQLLELNNKIATLKPQGETNIYDPVVAANALIVLEGQAGDRFPSIILMTDGESNRGSFQDVTKRSLNKVPVYGILFGSASQTQLDDIARYTSGRVFDGRKNLVDAFRVAKGYN